MVVGCGNAGAGSGWLLTDPVNYDSVVTHTLWQEVVSVCGGGFFVCLLTPP